MGERHGSRLAGQRYRDRPGGGLEGTGLVADDLYLLGHDDRGGRPLLQPRALGTGLAAALLAELLLAGQISVRRDSAVVIAAGTPGDTIARPALMQQIAGEPQPQPVRAWLRFLARSAAREVALRLEAAGYLAHVRGRARWSQGRWIPVSREWAFSPVLRVRAALDPARPVSAHGAALTGLAMACGLGYRVAGYLTQARRPVPDAIAVLDPAVQDLIAQTQTAVDSAVLSHRT
jgi:hypothetical protein